MVGKRSFMKFIHSKPNIIRKIIYIFFVYGTIKKPHKRFNKRIYTYNFLKAPSPCRGVTYKEIVEKLETRIQPQFYYNYDGLMSLFIKHIIFLIVFLVAKKLSMC